MTKEAPVPETAKTKVSSPLFATPTDLKVKPEKRETPHPHPYLQGNFYPVFEETVGDNGIECEVVGVIPECLRGGQYVRTGPNSLIIPDNQGPHHLFDGEGMLHGIYFPPGPSSSEGTGQEPIRPRYMNRFVRSDLYKKSNKHGSMMFSLALFMSGRQSMFQRIVGFLQKTIKLTFYRVTNMANGNTAVSFFGSRLLALNEAGLPFATNVPSLDTAGEYYFEQEGQSRGKPFLPNTEACTAHPKIAPNGDYIFYSWRVLPPFVYYSVVSADGKRVVWEQAVPGFTKPTMMHDFAITETRSVIMCVPYAMDPVRNAKKNGAPIMTLNTDEPTRFGIIPRYFNSKKDKVVWFETPTCHIFHTANAWDEKDADDNVVAVNFIACRSERFVTDINLWQAGESEGYGGGKTAEEYQTQYEAPGGGNYSKQDPDATYLTLFRFDLKTMETRLTTLSNTNAEFPVINFDWLTRPDLKYVYGTTIAPSSPGVGLKSKGIIKMNVQGALHRRDELRGQGLLKNSGGVGQEEMGTQALQEVNDTLHKEHVYGPNRYGNEATFVPNLPRADGQPLEEDDGYLLVYTYDESQLENGLEKSKDQITELWILNAKHLEREPVAKIKIPRRIPYGFHGIWLTPKQIQANKDLQKRQQA